ISSYRQWDDGAKSIRQEELHRGVCATAARLSDNNHPFQRLKVVSECLRSRKGLLGHQNVDGLVEIFRSGYEGGCPRLSQPFVRLALADCRRFGQEIAGKK